MTVEVRIPFRNSKVYDELRFMKTAAFKWLSEHAGPGGWTETIYEQDDRTIGVAFGFADGRVAVMFKLIFA